MLKYRKGVFCVIYLIEREKIYFLLLHRKLHWKGWEFCKGKSEDKEETKETVIREVKEETGHKPLEILKLGISGKFNYKKEEQKKWKFKGQTFISFLVKIRKKKIKIDKREHDKYIWTDYKEAMKLLTWPNQKKIFKVAYKNILKLKKR